MEDGFKYFDLNDRGSLGWECAIKSGVDHQTALSAATTLAKSAVCLMEKNASDANQRASSDWFHKTKSVLRCVIDGNIADALCDARINAASAAGEKPEVFRYGIKAASYHEWVFKAVHQLTDAGDDARKPVVLAGLSGDLISPLQIESRLACRLLLSDGLTYRKSSFLLVSHSLETTLTLISDCRRIAFCHTELRKQLPELFGDVDTWAGVPDSVMSNIRTIMSEEHLNHKTVISMYSNALIRASGRVVGSFCAGGMRAASAHELAVKLRQDFIHRVIPCWNDYLDWTEGGGHEWLDDEGPLTDKERSEIAISSGADYIHLGLMSLSEFVDVELATLLQQERVLVDLPNQRLHDNSETPSEEPENMEPDRRIEEEQGQIDVQKPYELNPLDWTEWMRPKNLRHLFVKHITSDSGWTDFANRNRNRGMIFNHPTSGPRQIRIHRSVFTLYKIPFPVT